MFGRKSDSAWFGPKGAPFNVSPLIGVRDGFYFRDDFQSTLQTSFNVTGTGSNSISAATASSRPGVLRQSVAAAATPDRASGTNFNLQGLFFGGGPISFETAVAETSAQDGVERWCARYGFLDSITADPVDGAWFEYDLAVNGNQNWFRCTASNSTRTRTDTGIAVQQAYQRLRLDINAAATAVQFLIDGVNAGQLTTNIPATSARVTGVGLVRIKTLGATARVCDIDYYEVIQRFTTRR